MNESESQTPALPQPSTTQNTSSVEVSASQKPTNEPLIPADWWKSVLKSILNEPAKYIIAFVSILYAIGFAIWHFYLAAYGVSIISFLQTEYISASLCYLFLLLTFSIPPILLLNTIKSNLFANGLLNYHKWEKHWVQISFVWYYVNNLIISIFLPGSKISSIGARISLYLVIIFAIHITFQVVLLIISGFFKTLVNGKDAKLSERNVRVKNSKLFKYGVSADYPGLYFLLFTVINLLFNSDLNIFFVISSLFFWFSLNFSTGMKLKQAWDVPVSAMRVVIAISIMLFLISNIRVFALFQFKSLPRTVGGGKPESVYFSISPEHTQIVNNLAMRSITNMATSNLMFGPISVLLRTDDEITFLDVASKQQFVTNRVGLLYTTNVIQNKASATVTNLVTTTLQFSVTPNIFFSSNGVVVKQIKTSLVDGILYMNN